MPWKYSRYTSKLVGKLCWWDTICHGPPVVTYAVWSIYCSHLFDVLPMQHLRDVTDPEHPYSLEQLNVVSEDLITVEDSAGRVRQDTDMHLYVSIVGIFLPCCSLLLLDTPAAVCRVQFTPTVQHCSMATLIGLSLRVKLMQTLPSRFKVCQNARMSTKYCASDLVRTMMLMVRGFRWTFL